MKQAEKGKVYLVGAGPGDPDLLTVKATSLLATADVVLHDDLISKEVLALAGAQALLISVGKRCGTKHIAQEQIHSLMIGTAQIGQSVVRLKSGDPLVFGRAGEEMDALRAAGIPFEVVPGITAAFAAAAAAQRPLTDRRSASSVTFLTAHRTEENANTPEHPDSGTRAIYMPGRNLQELAAAWLAQGESPDLPCVIVSRASHPDQAILRTTLSSLAEAKPAAAPSILLAGWALAEDSLSDAETLLHSDPELSQMQIPIPQQEFQND
jgi:uroporphyrin-III C-methyltransferase / precorrin-2 dehydrogenase / sirohydrochlorin ferrochelatase